MKTTRPFSSVRPGRTAHRFTAVAVAALACAIGAGSAQAFEFDTGNPDLTVRWDNTARVNLGMRTEKRDDLIGNNQLVDEGTYSFDRGDLVAGRLDWFSELDVAFQKRYGARISAQAWYDGAYGTYGRSNPNRPSRRSPATSTTSTPTTRATCTAAPTPSSWTPSSSAASTWAKRR